MAISVEQDIEDGCVRNRALRISSDYEGCSLRFFDPALLQFTPRVTQIEEVSFSQSVQRLTHLRTDWNLEFRTAQRFHGYDFNICAA